MGRPSDRVRRHPSYPVVPDGELLAVQRAAYLVEAALIGSFAIPALGDTLDTLIAAGLSWSGVRDESGLLGAVGIAVHANVVDIDRLVVAPRAFRRGVGTALVRHVLAHSGRDVTVSTGQANASARALYERWSGDEFGWVDTPYDAAYFSASLMLLPDPVAALRHVTGRLSPGGRLYFTQTFHHARSPLRERFKPLLRHVVTIDFGRVTYEDEFRGVLDAAGLVLGESVTMGSTRTSSYCLAVATPAAGG